MKTRVLSAISVFGLAITMSAQWAAQNDIPAYHDAPAKKTAKLSPILKPAALNGNGAALTEAQKKSYLIAAKIPGVLYQQPCFCHCDRHFGHDSLRACFTDQHGSQCGTCMAEAIYAYRMTKQGKTPKEIRAGIMKGDFNSVDLAKLDDIK
jgi:uncharacterized protein with PCYCGC motif